VGRILQTRQTRPVADQAAGDGEIREIVDRRNRLPLGRQSACAEQRMPDRPGAEEHRAARQPGTLPLCATAQPVISKVR
jgi:hypothetical protein